ncbi:MAG: nuclear transport factor 2 family protein [Rhodospirillaceae bacterium]|nr:nuclear transport factor 2 family protein [Rhodospirillaceae bacterium]
MVDVDARMTALEQRVRQLEDQVAIYQILSTYGAAADGASHKAMTELWTDDAVYDAQIVAFRGKAEILAMLKSDMHQQIITGGAAHVIGMPSVSIHGDTAVATCCARLYRKDGDSYRAWRVTACRWDLVRTAKGWRIKSRVNKLLNGDEDARELLRSGIE